MRHIVREMTAKRVRWLFQSAVVIGLVVCLYRLVVIGKTITRRPATVTHRPSLHVQQKRQTESPTRADGPEPPKTRLVTILSQPSLVLQKQRTAVPTLADGPETSEILSVARRIHMHSRRILFTLINEAYLPLTYSWLCNTRNLSIHHSVLIVTTDANSTVRLRKDWPEVNVVTMEMSGSHGNQEYSRAGYLKIIIKRTELLLALLQTGLEIFLFETDCVWLTNPIPHIESLQGADILVNPVSNTVGIFNGGLFYLFNTNRTIALWAELTKRMIKLGKRLENRQDSAKITEADNDQIYLSSLIVDRYADIKTNNLTLDKYPDGKWYSWPEEKKRTLHPLLINNNWIIGNPAKIARAKQWGHWFVNDDNTCNTDRVTAVVY